MEQTDFSTRRWARKRERGQALLEFTLTAPLILLLLLGLIEFGHGLNSYLTVVSSARDSARLGAQLGVSNLTPLEQVVADETSRLANGPVTGDSCTSGGQGICITSCAAPLNDAPACTGTPVDKWLNVEVCYDHSLLVGFPGVGIDPIHMCSSTEIRIAK